MSIYRTYDREQIDNLLSQFLVTSWSYSKVSTFARNQKAFEYEYVYGYRSKSSSTTVAGNAYHSALEHYFKSIKEGREVPRLVELTNIAFNYIEEVHPNSWKLQKTVPTIAKCIETANKTATSLIENFLKETSIYMEEVEEIIDVEVFGSQFVTVNGVDIPMPLNYRMDVVFKLKNGKKVGIDHKSKSKFTGEDAIHLTIGKQAITYVIGYEATHGIVLDEIWFMENKYSKNNDGSPQIAKFAIDFSNNDIRVYYEALLYEALRAMVQAVNDPDYVYILNDSDNFMDLAEMYQFHLKTMESEVEDFNIEPERVELVKKRLKKIKDSRIKPINPNIIKDFQKKASQFIQYDYQNSNMAKEEKIQHVLRTFGIIIEVAYVFDGYSSDTYLVSVTAGTKISQIQNKKLEIANALDVSGVRIADNLRVHEGKSYVAIEVGKKREKDLIFDKKYLVDYRIPLGKDNLGNVIFWDLKNHSTPHLLVGGSTGSGKSVELISITHYMKEAGVKDITILDPKYEFSQLKIKGVTVISDILEIEEFLIKAVEEMNNRVKKGGNYDFKVIIFDEFADAQAQSRKGKELDIYEDKEVGFYKMSSAALIAGAQPQPKIERVLVGQYKSLEENQRIILQKGRSVNIRFVAATQ